MSSGLYSLPEEAMDCLLSYLAPDDTLESWDWYLRGYAELCWQLLGSHSRAPIPNFEQWQEQDDFNLYIDCIKDDAQKVFT